MDEQTDGPTHKVKQAKLGQGIIRIHVLSLQLRQVHAEYYTHILHTFKFLLYL